MKGRYTVETFKGEDKQHYWRIKAHNGKVIAIGGEGFQRPSGARKSIKQLIVMFERGLYDFDWSEPTILDRRK